MKQGALLTILALACVLTIPSVADARYRDGMNLYEYVGSGPVGRVDPAGTDYIKTNDEGHVWWIIEKGSWPYVDKRWVWLGTLRGNMVEIRMGFAKGVRPGKCWRRTPGSNFTVPLRSLKDYVDRYWDKYGRDLWMLPRRVQDGRIGLAVARVYGGDMITGARTATYAAAKGYVGGSSITANTVTLGASDKLGLTNSRQYQGTAYEWTRRLSLAGRNTLTATGGPAVTIITSVVEKALKSHDTGTRPGGLTVSPDLFPGSSRMPGSIPGIDPRVQALEEAAKLAGMGFLPPGVTLTDLTRYAQGQMSPAESKRVRDALIAAGAAALVGALHNAIDPLPDPADEQEQEDAEKKGPDVRTLNPAKDPAPPVYSRGHPGQPVTDHVRARAAGGHPTNPANLDTKPWEWNARKGAYEGQLLMDRRRLIEQGLTPRQADAVLAGEWRWLQNDVMPRPVDPDVLDTTPSPGSR